MEGSGYHYATPEGVEMVNYHLDAFHRFQEEVNNRSTYGALVSVRKPLN